MLIRCRYGRRVQTYLKTSLCLLLAICYCLFLFRESLNAFEQNNREKSSGSNSVLVGINILELNAATNVLKQLKKLPPHKRLIHLQQLHHHGKQIVKTTTTANELITSSTLNPIYEYSEEIHRTTEQNLLQRRDYLNEMCLKYKIQSLYPPNPGEFLISPGHGLVWCNVFKAASSTWMYYFNLLGGYDIKFLQHTEMQPLELARKRFPRPELPELLENLASSISFLFAREPFERILSAYRNKLEGGRNTYYKTLGQRIIREFREHKTTIRGPTFEEFIQFLIAQHAAGNRFDEHWAPIYTFCTPCSLNFSIIGKLETFQRDSEFIIRQAGLESLLLGKLPKHKMRKITNLAKSGLITNESLVARYFSTINRKTLDQLLKIYLLDFVLFDYDYKKYYNLVQDNIDLSTIIATTTTTATIKLANTTTLITQTTIN